MKPLQFANFQGDLVCFCTGAAGSFLHNKDTPLKNRHGTWKNHTRLISEKSKKSSALSQPPYPCSSSRSFSRGVPRQVIMYHLSVTSVMFPHRLLSCAPGNKEVWEVNSTSWRRVVFWGMNEMSRELLKDIASCRFAKRIYKLRISFSKRNANLMMCQFIQFLILNNTGFFKKTCILLILCCNLEIPRWTSNQFPGSHPMGFTGCLKFPIGISFFADWKALMLWIIKTPFSVHFSLPGILSLPMRKYKNPA